VRTFAFSGIEAVPVEVQVQISSGSPALLLVGLPDKAVGEARERMRAAMSAMGLGLPPRRVLIGCPVRLPPSGLPVKPETIFRSSAASACGPPPTRGN
jgi:magnesium chelatase family protein